MSQSTVLKIGLALFIVVLAISTLFAGRPSSRATPNLPSGRHFAGLDQLLAEARSDTHFSFVPFDALAGYDCESGPEATPDIPASVRQLNGKDVCLIGFMIPVETSGRGVTLFMLLRNQMTCCYGVPPRPNDLIQVESPVGSSVAFTPDVPLLVSGRLEVGARYSDQELVCLYRMKANSVRLP